jgi:hypothetical protein
MSNYTRNTLTGDLAPINAELEKVQNAIADKLDRSPAAAQANQLNNTLDANSNRIINLPAPASPNDAARLVDLETAGPSNLSEAIAAKNAAVTAESGAVTARDVAVAASIIQYQTFAELLAISETVDYKQFTVAERANAAYTLQPSGYVVLAGDATLANGRVAALQIDGPALSGWFSTVQDAVDRTNSVLLTDDYTNSSPLSINCIARDFTLDGGGYKLTSDTAGNISAFGDLLHEEAVTSSTASTITVSASNSLITYLTANIEDNPIIKIVADDVIDINEDVNNRVGEFARVVSIAAGVLTLEAELYFTYTTAPRVFALISGKLTIKNLISDVTSLSTVFGTHIFAAKLQQPLIENVTVVKGNDAGIFLRSCYKSLILNPAISNLTDNEPEGRFGYGISDNAGFNNKIINGSFSNTRHAFTTNTSTAAAGGTPDLFGPTMYAEVIDSSCTGNSGDAFDTHPLAYFTVFSGVSGYKNLNGLVKDRGKFTKVINPVSEGDAYTVRNSARSDNLTIINPVSINNTAVPLFFIPSATSNVFISGGRIEKGVGNELVRFTNCNVTGSLNLKYTGAVDFSKFVKLTSSTLKLDRLSIDVKQSTAANIRIIEIASGGDNVVDIEKMTVSAISGSNALSLVRDITATGTNKAIIRHASLVDFDPLGGGLAQGSFYRYEYEGGNSEGFFVAIIANDQGINELTNNGSSVISLIVAVTGGTKSLVALPDGLFVAQKLKITMSKNSADFFKVRHGPTYNTDLISGADVTLVSGESMSLFWNGSDWEEFKQVN